MIYIAGLLKLVEIVEIFNLNGGNKNILTTSTKSI
jgi:hypothetical protein